MYSFSSYVPRTHRTAWIKSLTSRASRICSPNKLSSEISSIQKLASWSLKVLFIKYFTQQTKAPIMLNHLRYWSFTFLYLTIAIKNFRYSSLVCARFDLIGSKLFPLDLGPNMMLIKLSFIATLKIKQLFYVICLLFMIFLVLVVVPITLAKEKEHWIITDNNSAVYKHLNDCTGVQHLFNIAS